MSKLEELFLPYNIAELAKKKGFNEPSLAFYNKEKWLEFSGGKNSIGMEIESPFYNFDGFPLYDTGRVSAPVYQQMIDWLRTENNLHMNIRSTETGSFQYEIYFKNNGIQYKWITSGPLRKAYYEALNEGITQALNLVIDKKKYGGQITKSSFWTKKVTLTDKI